MSLGLSKNNSPAYDYYSTGGGTDPLISAVTVTNAGGTINSATVTAYIVATTNNYTSITMTTVNEVAGIDWKLSLNNIDWSDSITPSNMNATVADVVTPVYIRYVASNDGSVATGIYNAPDITISALEEPV